MIPINPTDKPEFPYSASMFDASYYGGGARGGFGPEINWDHQQQGVELQNKLDMVNENGEFKTILFIGCGTGNEIRFFRMKGKDASGVDISDYAISKCDDSIKSFAHVYNGWQLDMFKDRSFDVVASFDVLTLIPQDMLEKLASEMRRVCSNIIMFRTPVDKDSNQGGKYVGNDGVTFRCLTHAQWVTLFEADGFKFVRCYDTNNVPGEMVLIFKRS